MAIDERSGTGNPTLGIVLGFVEKGAEHGRKILSSWLSIKRYI